MTGCNNLQPLFGGATTGLPVGELGIVSWGRDANSLPHRDIEHDVTVVSRAGTSPVAGLNNAQVWSGHVFAQGCAKGSATNNTEFSGGVSGNLNADCRQSLQSVTNRAAARSGDLFSWCAVMRFADVLCPDGWRVPTTDDFRNLHWILAGGDTVATGGSAFIDITTSGLYAPNNAQGGTPGNNPAQVGGVWGGARFTGIASDLTTAGSLYWSSSEISATNARPLHFTATQVWPEGNFNLKNNGFALRCVRDVECDMIVLTSDTSTMNQTVGLGQIIAPVSVNLVSGVGGTATAVNIRWQRIDTISAGVFDTVSAAQPTGLTWTAATRTLSGSTTQAGKFIFEIFTTNHTAPCPEATFSGTLTVRGISVAGCNSEVPGWGTSLGTISWGTMGNTNIETDIAVIRGTGGRSGQIWSGAAFASACQKPTFNAQGFGGIFNADCRSAATNLTGHHFSWCAVMRFADQLCPYPWRVPSEEDFMILHQNLGHAAIPSGGLGPIIPNTFVPTTGSIASPNIGGRWGGARWTSYTVTGFGIITAWYGEVAAYWSSTDMGNMWTASTLMVHEDIVIIGENGAEKSWGLSLRCVRDTNYQVVLPQGCNPEHPNWLSSIGPVTWGSRFNNNIDSMATVVLSTGGGRYSQIWSGAVFASACNKGNATPGNEFVGGTDSPGLENWNADCRRSLHSANNAANPAAHITGDFFSWCAVMAFADQMCPYPWRVPTIQDFRDLHQNLGFPDALTHNNMMPLNTEEHRGRYMNPTTGTTANSTIGGVWGGARHTGHATAFIELSVYWSSILLPPLGGTTAIAGGLSFNANQVTPRSQMAVTNGHAVRCVRDTVIPTLPMIGCNFTPLFGGATTGLPVGQLGQVTWGNPTNTNINATTGTGAVTVVSRGGTSPVAGLPNTQTWSGHVFAQGCAKGNATNGDAFIGGGTGDFNADCRQSLHSVTNRSAALSGDLFSWCAVMRFADVLCPAPWRVPTTEDFRNLHWILTGNVVTAGNSAPVAVHNSGLYTLTDAQGGHNLTNPAQVGGVWGGARFAGWASPLTVWNSRYWSSSEINATLARTLSFDEHNVWPELPVTKNGGFALRCVR